MFVVMIINEEDDWIHVLGTSTDQDKAIGIAIIDFNEKKSFIENNHNCRLLKCSVMEETDKVEGDKAGIPVPSVSFHLEYELHNLKKLDDLNDSETDEITINRTHWYVVETKNLDKKRGQ